MQHFPTRCSPYPPLIKTQPPPVTAALPQRGAPGLLFARTHVVHLTCQISTEELRERGAGGARRLEQIVGFNRQIVPRRKVFCFEFPPLHCNQK